MRESILHIEIECLEESARAREITREREMVCAYVCTTRTSSSLFCSWWISLSVPLVVAICATVAVSTTVVQYGIEYQLTTRYHIVLLSTHPSEGIKNIFRSCICRISLKVDSIYLFSQSGVNWFKIAQKVPTDNSRVERHSKRVWCWKTKNVVLLSQFPGGPKILTGWSYLRAPSSDRALHWPTVTSVMKSLVVCQ